MLPSGAVIVMYTDGLVERRDRDLDTGIDALAAHVRAGSDPVQTLPGSLVDALAPEGSEDDIAILIARISDESVQRKAELEVPPVGSAVQDGRRFATATLTDWAVPPEVVQDATLIVSELLDERDRLRESADPAAAAQDPGGTRDRGRRRRERDAAQAARDADRSPRSGSGDRGGRRQPVGSPARRLRQDGVEHARDPADAEPALTSGWLGLPPGVVTPEQERADDERRTAATRP